VLLPVRSAPPADPSGLLRELDALLLPGGCDVDPVLYGEERGERLGGIDPELDHLEVELVRRAVDTATPPRHWRRAPSPARRSATTSWTLPELRAQRAAAVQERISLIQRRRGRAAGPGRQATVKLWG
jgi:hypothetical protein